jgi:hypothetical protein
MDGEICNCLVPYSRQSSLIIIHDASFHVDSLQPDEHLKGSSVLGLNVIVLGTKHGLLDYL